MQKESIKWTTPNGNILFLHGGEFTSLMGRAGLDNVSWALTRKQTPGTHGSVVTQVRGNERTITIPLLLQASSPEDLQTARRLISKYAVPSTSPGTLQFTSVDGTVRSLSVYYAGGLEGKDTTTSSNLLWQNMTIRFLAVDPFWFGSEITETYSLSSGEGEDFLGDPFFPLRISSSTVVDSPTIDMIGDVESFPIWTITGPGEDLIFQNNTTGKAIKLTNNGSYVLALGEVIVIDTRPKVGKTVVVFNTQENLFSYLTKDSEFFGLIPGDNDVSLQLNNATVDTRINLAYFPNYVGK